MNQPQCARCGEFEMPGHICVDILASLAADRQGCYDDDPVWDALFARSQDMLMAMAEEALEDARAGRTVPLDLEMIYTVTVSAGAAPMYITASPPAPGPVSIPSVFDTFPPADIGDLTFRIALRAAQASVCPHCGKPMEASTPAHDAPAPVSPLHSADRGVVPVKQANVTDEPPPSGYMSRDKLL